MRVHTLGPHGAVVYLVFEDMRRVDVLLIIWLG